MLHLATKIRLVLDMLYEQQLSIVIPYESAPIIISLILTLLGVALHIAVIMATIVLSLSVTGELDFLLLMVWFFVFLSHCQSAYGF